MKPSTIRMKTLCKKCIGVTADSIELSWLKIASTFQLR